MFAISAKEIAIVLPFGAAVLVMLWILWNFWKQGKS